MTTRQENLILFSLETAKRANNFLDNDVLADAIGELKKSQSDVQVQEALAYIATCLAYCGSKKEALLIESYASQFLCS